MNKPQTAHKALGDFQAKDKLTKQFKLHHVSSIQGIGEDAAIIDTGKHYTLVTSHMLLEGIHFDLAYCPLKHLGYKAVVIALANIAAMNGIPEQISINIGGSNRFTLEALEALFQGIYGACQQYTIDLVHETTSSTAAGLVIAITGIGKANKNSVCLRKGAKPHDIVCVTGDLGAAYIGLQVLNREKQVFQADPHMQPVLEPYQYMVQRQLKPEARMDIIQTMTQLQLIPTAMIDIADGLASELFHISKAAGMGLTIYENKLPINKHTYETAVSFNLDPTMCAVNGGEDYELLFTIQQKDFQKIANNQDIACIGYVTEPSQGINLITNAGSVVPLVAPGWEQYQPGC